MYNPLGFGIGFLINVILATIALLAAGLFGKKDKEK